MSGAEEETKRAVGRRRDGSSASVSVSPAQSWPGAVDIVFAAAPVVRKRRPGVASSRRRGPRRCIWGAGRLPRRFRYSLVESW